MEWKQLQSNIARCSSAMNAFLWALGKLNFPLGKEHIYWLKLLPLRILINLSCKAKQSPLNFNSSKANSISTWSQLICYSCTQGGRLGFCCILGFFFSLHELSPLYSLHSSAHQAGKHGHDHLWLHLHKIFWKSINSGTNFSCHGHCIPVHNGKRRWSAPRLLPVNKESNPAPSNTITPILY